MGEDRTCKVDARRVDRAREAQAQSSTVRGGAYPRRTVVNRIHNLRACNTSLTQARPTPPASVFPAPPDPIQLALAETANARSYVIRITRT